jgi:hypothetical protein
VLIAAYLFEDLAKQDFDALLKLAEQKTTLFTSEGSLALDGLFGDHGMPVGMLLDQIALLDARITRLDGRAAGLATAMPALEHQRRRGHRPRRRHRLRGPFVRFAGCCRGLVVIVFQQQPHP